MEASVTTVSGGRSVLERSPLHRLPDQVLQWGLSALAAGVLILIAYFFIRLIGQSSTAFSHIGFLNFFVRDNWDVSQLQASGVNVTQVADALSKVLPANEMLAIIGTLASPLPLQYSTSLTGDALIEPTTGIVVSTHSVKRFFVGPDPASLAPVKAILDRHSSDPVVKAVDDNLFALVGTPRAAFTLDYTTDAASARSMASYADHQRGRVLLARLILPAGLLVLGAALAVGAYVAWRRQPKRTIVLPDEPRRPPVREKELVGV